MRSNERDLPRLSRPSRRRWEAVLEAVVGRLRRWPFWVKVGLYPKWGWLEESDKCSVCRLWAARVDAVIAHARGIRHLRNWCLEHPEEARVRFPEAMPAMAEERLTEATA